MKIIKQHGIILNKPDTITNLDIYKYLEMIGRTCYKSENKIDDTSAPKFIDMLNRNHHWAMLEHYIFRIEVSQSILNAFGTLKGLGSPWIQEALKYIQIVFYAHSVDNCDGLIIGSATAFNGLMEALVNSKPKIYNTSRKTAIWEIIHTIMYLHENYPSLVNSYEHYIENKEDYKEYKDFFISYKNLPFSIMKTTRVVNDTYIAKLINIFNNESSEESKITAQEIFEFATWFSVKLTTNRGVTHELCRHRPASFAQESTRYCNYSNDKFGDEITVIDPIYYVKDSNVGNAGYLHHVWVDGCRYSEEVYMRQIQNGATAQMARGNLPTDIKADIVITATLHEWHHIFHMRCEAPAHPMVRDLMIPIMDETINYYQDQGITLISDYLSDIIRAWPDYIKKEK